MQREGKGIPQITAIAYSTDAREILTANSYGEIITYSTDGYWISSIINAGKIYDHIALSPNGYFIAAAYGKEMDIWNVETSDIKRIIHFAGDINHMTFSPDSREIAVSCDTAGLQIVNAIDHHRFAVSSGIENVRQASFHPEGKYIAYAKADSVIVYNLINHKAVCRPGRGRRRPYLKRTSRQLQFQHCEQRHHTWTQLREQVFLLGHVLPAAIIPFQTQ